ncbi:MAG TPA: hypothetical protein VGJ86_00160 [Acidimicrobiales bacterium]
MVLRRERAQRFSIQNILAFIGVACLVVLVLHRGWIDFPKMFDGGKSDPAPRGSVIYEGQTAESASEEFLVDIGNGNAIVSVKAKQNHDKPGNIFSGDFQSTNGTSSVADPEDRDVPAKLEVKTDYCSEGLITTTVEPDDDDADNDPQTTIRLEMGSLFVCNTTLEHTTANDAAFKQDDTPTDFHGRFVSFVAGAAETAAAAAACPTDELNRFGSEELTTFMEQQLAERFHVPAGSVTVVPGHPGESSANTKRELRDQLESYANLQDPDHPDREFEALSIQYLSGDEEAVEDSCYKDPGGRDLDTLEDVQAPDPTR